jgi:vancomycin resistance protein YoaR
VTDRPDDRLPLDELGDPADGASSGDDGRRDRRLLRWVVLTLVVVLGGLYLAGYAFARDRLPENTEIAGVGVGGLDPDTAERRLAAELEDDLQAPVRLDVEGEEVTLDAEEAGLDVDVPASVAQVPAGRSWNPADMWETLVGGQSYDPVVVTVDDLLTHELTELAAEAGEKPVEGAVTFTAQGPEPTYPEAGSQLDVDAAVEAVVSSYPTDEAVEIELVADEPAVSRAEVSRAMEEFANPAMAAPVTYVVKGKEVVLRPAQYARALSMAPEGDRLVPKLDRKRFATVLNRSLRGVAIWPRNASFRIEDGRPQVVPSRSGLAVDRKKAARSFLSLVAADEGKRRANLPTVVREPELTTAEAKQLGVKEVVSEFTTYYPHAEYRNVNIGRGAELINGTLLLPGETFSLNETVGERTVENGFTAGTVISNGVFKEDLGGGVSQVATTTFNAAFFAGLEDVEHKPHSFYISRYPVGREATVAWPTVDLRFRNDTDHGVYIQTVHTPSTGGEGSLTVRMWSTKVWDIESVTSERYAFTPPETRRMSGPDCIPNEGYGGFQVDVTRIFREAGKSEVHHREVMHTTYTPSDRVICE